MTVVRQRHCCQRHTMGGVRVSSHRLAKHMHHPVGALSLRDQGIQSPGCRPHDIAAGFIIGRLLYRNTTCENDRTHQSLCDIITGIVILTGKILLTDMVENVINPCHHLVLRQCKGEFRVEDGKLREYLRSKHMTDFQLLLMIGDHRATVHFASRSHHGQNAAHGNDFTGRFLKTDIILLPGIFLAVNRYGNCLRIIADRSAAYSQNQIRPAVSGALYALPELFHRWIGHDTRVFRNSLAALFQYRNDLIVDTVFLNGTSSITEQHIAAILLKLLPQMIH